MRAPAGTTRSFEPSARRKPCALFHERMPRPPRTKSGRRLYGQAHVGRLAFVRRARELGFTLEQVGGLAGLAARGGQACAEVQAIALAHLTAVRRKLADLRRLERVLAATLAQCAAGRLDACPIIEALSRDMAAAR